MYRCTLESNTKGLRDLSEIQRWTVIPAKLLTLFIIPTFYLVLEGWAAKRFAAAPVVDMS